MLVLETVDGSTFTLTPHVVKKADDLPKLMKEKPDEFVGAAAYYPVTIGRGQMIRSEQTTITNEVTFNG